ncbi:MAG: PE-PPE domain-containing protein [Candidatus Nomurabacteria bacterium]|nr:MAG: PE-PPE domain-containing protein [Candidatus Nomurabacteria bacterium]
MKRLFCALLVGLLSILAAVFGAFSANAVIAIPQISADVVAYMGPTFDPTGRIAYEKAKPYFGQINDGREVQFIEYPAGLWPATGPGTDTLDESVKSGTSSAIALINADVQDGHKVALLTGSQGAVVFTEVKKYYDSLPPDQSLPADTFMMILIANPDRPNGGMLSRFPGLHIPGLNITFNGPTPNDQFVTYDVGNAYDGFSNFPRYPLDLLSTVNAIMGITYEHGTPPNVFDPNVDVSTSVVGNTTYYLIMPEHLPLLRPLYDAGWGGVANVIEPLLRVWVDAGYDNNDPRSNPGLPESARLFIPLRNIVTALKKSPDAIMEGLNTIPASIHQFLSHPVANTSDTVKGTVREVKSLTAIGTQKIRSTTGLTVPSQPNVTGKPTSVKSVSSFKPGDGVKKAVSASHRTNRPQPTNRRHSSVGKARAGRS